MQSADMFQGAMLDIQLDLLGLRGTKAPAESWKGAQFDALMGEKEEFPVYFSPTQWILGAPLTVYPW